MLQLPFRTEISGTSLSKQPTTRKSIRILRENFLELTVVCGLKSVKLEETES
nr:MAG: hypothetical protein [Actinidia virus 1]UIW14059.1 MAG: hypothetical protein [Actinidia virus 1]